MKRLLLIPLILSLPMTGQGTVNKKPKASTKDKTSELSLSQRENMRRVLAEGGDARAQWEMGFFCQVSGKNLMEAEKWYRKAANQGYAEGQFNLGNLYENGAGLPQNDNKAVEWYEKAAKQGHAEAQCFLGSYYERGGRGVIKDISQAAKWYRKAAMQGWADAQGALAYCYALGDGVPEDASEAYVWASLAVANKPMYEEESSFLKLRNLNAERLSPQALERAQERARKLHEEIQARMENQR